MEATSTEVQNNFGAYLKYAHYEKVYITRNGISVAVLGAADPPTAAEERPAYGENKPKLSLDEFLDLVSKSDKRYEYIGGEVILSASPSFQHQRIVVALVSLLQERLEKRPCKTVAAPFDVSLQTGDLINVVQPDVVVICDLENINEQGRYSGIPTILVEVLSESSRSHDMIKKLELYRAGGVKEYWIVNPFAEEIYIYTFEDFDIADYRVYSRDAQLSSSALEGLEIAVGQLFS